MTEKEESVQRSVAWPKVMYRAIVRQAKKRKIPTAAYIRYAVEKQLRDDGEDVKDDLMWGGYRYSGDDPQEDDQKGYMPA